VPRRNLIPFLLLAVLVILALVFAVIGQRSSPNRASLAVENATSATFGDPAGSNSFTMNLSASLSASLHSSFTSQKRLITYRAPSRLTVYQVVGTRTVRRAVLGPSALPCVLSSYTSIVGGETAWSGDGTTYTRDETLAEFSSRVPNSSSTTCEPEPSAVRGSVAEQAILRSGYLVDLTIIVSVPAQRLANGQPAAHGIEGERLAFLTIGGTAVADL
jgi:hypothetical protein